MARVFSEYAFYSPLLDGRAVRVSTVDAHGGEFFAIVPKPPAGRSWRERRERVLSVLQAAIDSGLDPGPVEVNLDGP